MSAPPPPPPRLPARPKGQKPPPRLSAILEAFGARGLSPDTMDYRQRSSSSSSDTYDSASTPNDSFNSRPDLLRTLTATSSRWCAATCLGSESDPTTTVPPTEPSSTDTLECHLVHNPYSFLGPSHVLLPRGTTPPFSSFTASAFSPAELADLAASAAAAASQECGPPAAEAAPCASPVTGYPMLPRGLRILAPPPDPSAIAPAATRPLWVIDDDDDDALSTPHTADAAGLAPPGGWRWDAPPPSTRGSRGGTAPNTPLQPGSASSTSGRLLIIMSDEDL
eukprot:EG_transcript_9595